MKRIKWNRSREGFKNSKCGRFEIIPKFCGCTEAQAYTLQRRNSDGGVREISLYCETQREAKEDAEDCLEREKARGIT